MNAKWWEQTCRNGRPGRGALGWSTAAPNASVEDAEPRRLPRPHPRWPAGVSRTPGGAPRAVRAAGAGGGAERAGAGGGARVRRGHLHRGHGVPRAAREGPAPDRDPGDARASGGLADPGARVPGPGGGHPLSGGAPARFLPARGPSAPPPPAAAGRGLPVRGLQSGRVRAARVRFPLLPGRRLLLAGRAPARRAPHPEPPGVPAAPPGPAALPRAPRRAGPEPPPGDAARRLLSGAVAAGGRGRRMGAGSARGRGAEPGAPLARRGGLRPRALALQPRRAAPAPAVHGPRRAPRPRARPRRRLPQVRAAPAPGHEPRRRPPAPPPPARASLSPEAASKKTVRVCPSPTSIKEFLIRSALCPHWSNSALSRF